MGRKKQAVFPSSSVISFFYFVLHSDIDRPTDRAWKQGQKKRDRLSEPPFKKQEKGTLARYVLEKQPGVWKGPESFREVVASEVEGFVRSPPPPSLLLHV